MLSPGEYHADVPRDLGANLHYRAGLLDLCDRRPELRPAVLEMCRQDVLYYVLAFAWQFNPRHVGHECGPFVTWPEQEQWVKDAVQRLWGEQRDLVEEKSREVGATWLALLRRDWAARFHPWKKFLLISHTEQAVDTPGDLNSLFGKLVFVNDHLPGWFPQAVKRKLAMAYPATSSAITGAATTKRAGVGGRVTDILCDEFALQGDDFEIFSNTADTGPREFVSTHYGTGTKFFQLTRSNSGIKKLVMHWSAHPEKNRGLYRCDETGKIEILDKTYPFPGDYPFVTDGSPTGGPFPGLRSPWYDAECVRRDNARDVALHLDIDPKGSAEQFFDPVKVMGLRRSYCRTADWRGDVQYDRDTGEPIRLVSAPGGPLSLWFEPSPEGTVPLGLYAAGADIAQGTGASPSCLSVLDVRTGEKVAEYENAWLAPQDYALVVVALSKLFAARGGAGARLVWEASGPSGKAFGIKVERLGYRNIYYRTEQFDIKHKVSDQPGWFSNEETKPLLLEEYRGALYSGLFLNRSERALEQTLGFKYGPRGEIVHDEEESKGSPSGARLHHGDHVIADALAWMMAKALGAGAPLAKREEIVPEAAPFGSLAHRRLLKERERSESWESAA